MVCLLLVGCASAPAQPPSIPAASPVETAMSVQTVHVRTADELRSVSAALSEMVYAENPGGKIEVIIHAGRYSGLPLRLDARRSPVDITVRGEGDPVMEGLSIEVVARSVSVSGLQFTGRFSQAALNLQGAVSVGAEAVHFRQVQVAPERRGGGARGAIVNLEVLADGAELSLKDCTMEGASVPGSTLLYLWMPPGKTIASAVLERWTVRDVTVKSLVKVGVIEALAMRDVALEVPSGAHLLDVHTARQRPSITGGRVAVDDVSFLSTGKAPELRDVDLRLRRGSGD